MAQAVSFLLAKRVSRIILARPAVEAGEKLGFLPGDLQEKVNPYLRPLYDALYDMLEIERAERLLERGTIEVAPIAFMRGRTLNDAFVILDEAQNTTSEQMKMFLTRLGFGSKAVITGDVTQIDLPVGRASGLVEAMKIVGNIEGHRVRPLRRQGRRAPSTRAADREGVRSVRWIPTVAGCASSVTDGRGRPVRGAGACGQWLASRGPALARAAARGHRPRHRRPRSALSTDATAARTRRPTSCRFRRTARRRRSPDVADPTFSAISSSRPASRAVRRAEAGHSYSDRAQGAGASRPAAPARLRSPRGDDRGPDGPARSAAAAHRVAFATGLIERASHSAAGRDAGRSARTTMMLRSSCCWPWPRSTSGRSKRRSAR